MPADKAGLQPCSDDLLVDGALYTSHVSQNAVGLHNCLYQRQIVVIFLHGSAEENIIAVAKACVDGRRSHIRHAVRNSQGCRLLIDIICNDSNLGEFLPKGSGDGAAD